MSNLLKISHDLILKDHTELLKRYNRLLEESIEARSRLKMLTAENKAMARAIKRHEKKAVKRCPK